MSVERSLVCGLQTTRASTLLWSTTTVNPIVMA